MTDRYAIVSHDQQLTGHRYTVTDDGRPVFRTNNLARAVQLRDEWNSSQSSDEATPSDDSAPPAVATPDTTGGALPVGARVRMHSMNNTEVWRGRITQALSNTPADHRRVVWDDGCWVSTVPADRLEAVS